MKSLKDWSLIESKIEEIEKLQLESMEQLFRLKTSIARSKIVDVHFGKDAAEVLWSIGWNEATISKAGGASVDLNFSELPDIILEDIKKRYRNERAGRELEKRKLRSSLRRRKK